MKKQLDPQRCVEEVFSASGGYGTRQCGKKRGHGTDGLYCTEHARSTKDIEPSKDKRRVRDKIWH